MSGLAAPDPESMRGIRQGPTDQALLQVRQHSAPTMTNYESSRARRFVTLSPVTSAAAALFATSPQYTLPPPVAKTLLGTTKPPSDCVLPSSRLRNLSTLLEIHGLLRARRVAGRLVDGGKLLAKNAVGEFRRYGSFLHTRQYVQCRRRGAERKGMLFETQKVAR